VKYINKVTSLYHNVNPSKDNWIGGSTGIGGIGYNSVATRDYIRIELYFNTGDKENNKRLFDELFERKIAIETAFGNELQWERLDEKITARIKFELSAVNIFNEDDWQKMIEFMVDVVPKFEAAFKKPLQEIGRK
jgi:hypothetical protein